MNDPVAPVAPGAPGTPSPPELSVVAPVFNEAGCLEAFHQRVSAVLHRLGVDAEIVYVDDGSTDESPRLLERLAETDPRVRVLTFSRNFGHQLAITAGLDRAAGEAVVVIDSDLQDPPELIEDMVREWREGADVVHAVRDERKGESRFKLATARGFYRLIRRLTDVEIQLDSGDFKLMDRAVVDVVCSMRERHRFVRGMVAWAGFRQVGVHYVRDARAAGDTKYPLRRMIRLALTAITSFSYVPLQLASVVGMVAALSALVLTPVVIVARALDAPYLTGQTTALLGVLFLGGLQLLFLGLVGEYLGRLVDEVKQRPLYVVASDRGRGTASSSRRSRGARGSTAAASHDASASADAPSTHPASDAPAPSDGSPG